MIIVYKVGYNESKIYVEWCVRELEVRGCKVLMGFSGIKDNFYLVFLVFVIEKIDLVLVLGGDGIILVVVRYLFFEGIFILFVNVGGYLGFLMELFDVF